MTLLDPAARSELSDEQIDAVARELFFRQMDDKEGDWGPNSINQLWCEDVGRPFARAVLAAARVEPIPGGVAESGPLSIPDIHAHIRKAGGIVHGDGNIFFTRAEQFIVAAVLCGEAVSLPSSTPGLDPQTPVVGSTGADWIAVADVINGEVVMRWDADRLPLGTTLYIKAPQGEQQ